MKIHKSFKDFQVEIFDDTLYDTFSADNVIKYNKLYSDKENEKHINLNKHGIQIFSEDELKNSACVMASGGKTDIHETGLHIENNKILICCGNNIFCLTLPDLELVWNTEADWATCFNIFSYKGDFIVHGELEISRLKSDGQIMWQFSGTDIFVTPNKRGVFEIQDDRVIAANWEGDIYELCIDDGKVINHKPFHSQL